MSTNDITTALSDIEVRLQTIGIVLEERANQPTVVPNTAKCWLAFEDANVPIIAWLVWPTAEDGAKPISVYGVVDDINLVKYADPA